MDILTFHLPALNEYDQIYAYMSQYGEGSCQHSFVSMYSLTDKYADKVCVSDGFLYTLRERLCGNGYRAYLAPMGCGDAVDAYKIILSDAHAYGKKAKFITLTERQTDLVENGFPGLFKIEEDRGLAEYIYKASEMAYLPGGKLAKRRKEAHQFWNTYGGSATVQPITETDFEEIIAFERDWIEQNTATHDREALQHEEQVIARQLAAYDALHLSGVVLRLDGRVRGFSYGTRISDTHYDALIEKGDKDLVYAYRVLRQESVKQCAMDCDYVNLEEDLNIPGLRALKCAYQPEMLLRKFIVTEL